MISIFQAIIIGVIQGFTELFPISSLGHSVVIPKLLHWNLNQNQPSFLTFLVATHLATAIVLFLFFYAEWVLIIKGIARSLRDKQIKKDDKYARLGWLIVVSTIPAGLIGLLFKDSISKLFASAKIAAFFLIVNGFILLLAEKLRKSKKETSTETSEGSDSQIAKKLNWPRSILIGICQSFALIPGISRSGASMAGGLAFGLDNYSAARFSFLLATPVIGAAALLELPSLFSNSYSSIRPAIIIGAFCAAISAFISVKFLVKYFKTKTLTPFAIYCLAGGIIYSIFLFR
jgi:undecaprenyl-diphosphatase